METASNTAMHLTETKTLRSNPNCSKTKNEEITREREEELLYGSNEDCDDEDALSDDSFRLRVSDEGEEQQPTNRDLTEEVIAQKITEMEPGSDVPPSDKTERKSSLNRENLTNGTCTIENDWTRVEDTNERTKDSSSAELTRRTENFEGRRGDESRNGDIDESASIEASKVEKSSNRNWRFSGRFGEYARRGKRHGISNQSFPMNSYSEKYYNQNTHYGKGRSCTKSYQGFHQSKGSRGYLRPGGSTSPTLENTIDRSKSKETTDRLPSPNLNVESSNIDASPAVDIDKSEVAIKIENAASNLPTEAVPEFTDILTKKDNADAAYDCTNKSDSILQVDQSGSVFPKAERSSPIMDEESIKLDDREENARVINEIDPDKLGETTDDARAHVSSNPLDHADGRVQLPNNVPETKTGQTETFETVNEEKMFENGNPDKTDESVSENTEEPEKSENLEVKKNKETVENQKVTTEVKEANHETATSEEAKESVNNKKGEPSETCVKNNDDQVQSRVASDCENDQTDVSESKGVEKHEKTEEINESIKTVESTSNQRPIDASNDEEYPKTVEAKAIKQEDRERDDGVKSVDENPEGSKASDCPTEPEVNAEKGVNVESLPESERSNLGAVKLAKDLLIVAIVEPKTNESESAIVPIEPGAPGVSEIPLTDTEKKAFSTGISDDAESSKDLDNDATTIRSSLKRASTDILLDEMDLSKRMQIDSDRRDVTSESDNKDPTAQVSGSTIVETETTEAKDKSIVGNAVTSSNGESQETPEGANVTNNFEKSSVSELSTEEKTLLAATESHENDDEEKSGDCEVIEIPVKRKQKRSRRSLNSLREGIVSHEDLQETENVRQKRKTAQNAEEIIRKECLANTDSESNDSLSKFVTINHRTNNNSRATSPPTLKRNFVDEDETRDEGTTTKKLKVDDTLNGDIATKDEPAATETKRPLQHVRNFFRRDPNGILCKLRQEELEELLIQKIVETLTMRDEIGKLREQAKVSERNQEATRIRCQQLAKQIKDFEMVLNRYKSDLRSNPDSKTVVPIKINRSVGLQVNFVTDHGIQNLRQLQQSQKMTGPPMNGAIVLQQQQQQQQQQMQQQKQTAQQSQPSSEPVASGQPVKRTVKVRSPRRPEPPPPGPAATAVSTPVNSPHVSTVTPAALVVSKPVSDSRLSVTPANQPTTVMHTQLISPNQAILVNGNVTAQPIRQVPTLQTSKAKNSDLIDLTQEEEKTKTPVVTQNTILTAALAETSPSVSNIQKLAPRFHTVIQTLPGNMSLTGQSGIRVVQPSSQPTPTALVNNMNAPRLTYVTMQSGIVPRQVLLTSTPTPIRPAPANNIRNTFPISGTISNSTVRVLPAPGTTLLYKHPAALPESLNTVSSPSLKLPPPAPSLKISKVANGIVLSWNMALSDRFADIASYQLYAYQELAGIPPSSALWKKVGDVRALPLPMACTLTQFSEGNNYYFAVRAVDKHSRLGQYSQPGNISL